MTSEKTQKEKKRTELNRLNCIRVKALFTVQKLNSTDRQQVDPVIYKG